MHEAEDGAGPAATADRLERWRAWQASPWGQIRYRLVSETLRRTVAGLGPGRFDLVLCHNVVQYCHDLDAAIGVLVRQVAPSGALSLLAPNPAADVLATAVRREEPAAALDLLDTSHLWSETFGEDLRRIPASDALGRLGAHGLDDVRTYGIAAVTHLVADGRKGEPEFYRELEALELALVDREPFLRVARFWQLVARRA